MFKINKIISLLIIAGFIVAFSATDLFAQKGGKGRYRKVALKKDARTNGYKVTEQSRKFYLQIFGAEHPITKRRLSAEELVEYKCREMLKAVERRILFNNGNTDLFEIECSESDLIFKPQILLLDEPE